MIVSGMTMEEIFKERQLFKSKVIENVQTELNQFGLRIYNANVKELQDTAGSEYFKFLSRKAHEGASNQAKVDVANACMMGEIGVCISILEINMPYSDCSSKCQASSGARVTSSLCFLPCTVNADLGIFVGSRKAWQDQAGN